MKIDPSCGAGHILLYAFDILYEIYLRAGYEPEVIPMHIFENNLYGLDIDEKVIRLCRFALLMKAREKYPDFLNQVKQKAISWNILWVEESNNLGNDDFIPSQLKESYYNAKVLGSIINVDDIDTKECRYNLEKLKASSNIEEKLLDNVEHLIHQTIIMQQKYHVVVANPPYMSNKMMPRKLKDYVDLNFKDFKGDLFSVFIKCGFKYAHSKGYVAFMTPFVWMFIRTYYKLRKYIIDNKTIVNLIQLQYSGFDGATVPICTFVLENEKKDYAGDFLRLADFKGVHNQPKKVLEAIQIWDVGFRFKFFTKGFKEIPGMPIAYWISNAMMKAFQQGIPLRNLGDARVGLQTSDNKRFVRFWYEVPYNSIGFKCSSREEAFDSGKKWFPYNKGGDYRKWYGNHLYVVNWEGDGEEIRAYNSYLNRTRSSNIGIANTQYYFKRGITWSFVSSSFFSVRYAEHGSIFDTAGSTVFPEDRYLYYLIGFLCSKVAYRFLNIINPTLNFQPGNVADLPILLPKDKSTMLKLECLVRKCIDLSREEWNDLEIAWGFKLHPLIKYRKSSMDLEEAMKNCIDHTVQRFQNLHDLDEDINKIFIEIYGLQNDMTFEIGEQEVTIKRYSEEKQVRSFLSYAVGCILGRYSLKEEGVFYGGGDFDRGYTEFQTQQDGILPIYAESAYGQDIITELNKFLGLAFGKESLQKNVEYIADKLIRRKDESSEERIRRYFLSEFYRDHVKLYQKRPIYWCFSSGTHKSFQALVYFHRIDPKAIDILMEKYVVGLLGKLKKEMTRSMDNDKSTRNLSDKIAELVKYRTDLKAAEKNIALWKKDGCIVDKYKKLKSVLVKIGIEVFFDKQE